MYWFLGICAVVLMLSLIGLIREHRERQRQWKKLLEEMGEDEFRAALRRVLLEKMVDDWMPPRS